MPGSPRLQAWIDGGEIRRLAGHAVFTRRAVTAGLFLLSILGV